MNSGFFNTILQIFASIFAACISARALVVANRANISDKITRSQWAFEMYIMSFETFRISKESNDYAKFCSYALLFYTYVDKELKPIVLEINNLVDNNEIVIARRKIYKFVDIYYEQYGIKQYSLKRYLLKMFIQKSE